MMNSGLADPFTYLENADIPDDVRTQCETLLNHHWDGWQYGRSPRVAAAMAVYYVNHDDEQWTQKQVANMFDTTAASMRDMWTDMREDLDRTELEALVGNLHKVDTGGNVDVIETAVNPPGDNRMGDVAELATELTIDDKILFNDRKQPLDVTTTSQSKRDGGRRHHVVLDGPNNGIYTIAAVHDGASWDDVAIYQGTDGDLSENTRIDRVTSLSVVETES